MGFEKIEDLGWDDFFESQKSELNLVGFPVARITGEHRGAYQARNTGGEFLAKITGKQMFEARSREDFPAVGDWVAITELDNNQAQIKAVLPRKTMIKRKFGDRNKKGDKSDVQIIAANIDVAFLVQSIGRDYNLNRFDRFLAMVRDTGIRPVIVVNKIDLLSPEELGSIKLEILNRLGDIDIIFTSTVNDQGVETLKNNIEKRKTYCFLGSSGVGKSSLINRLLGGKAIKTDAIGTHSNRGKHVTTSRQMYFLAGGGIVIDNPGVREVGLTDVDEGVDSLLGEIARLAKQCQYADCTHIHEPGCEILAALEDGRLDEDKYANYIRLKKEIDHYEMSDWEKRDKNRQFGKFMKKAKKDFKNYGHKYY